MFKYIGIAVVVVIAAVLALAATRPDTFRVERSTTIKAPPEKVYALIEDFHQWQQWSPWERLDPAMKRQHGGAPKGKGALYGWEGNKEVGKGQMEITEATLPSRVVIKLDFLAPFEAHNTAEFVLVPRGDATTVTWAMSGPNLFIGKVMSLFASMDSLVGKDFERGLANLKAVAEK
ncbi:SRPBCC family protein [Piscinibacter gummiphilus]|uniref:Polyketide cyclase n=1 Tax=Piscinibacter gummiphilus TaxID=946333 RepID=A0A1W6L4N9_9BURK|nr:SRPBCC family protein [Piscinibacter gummiphilus]ARN19138.1 polyketide cyclase [Piscinibacter gummiphilus]ATU63792.1 polyketide cyclase [Piscinibacter gummiphilus]GLS93269.1 potassium-transporting ATPase subunit F [Piscinibacter gummiphilus]